MEKVEYKIAGDSGLVVSFGDEISEQINKELLFFSDLIKKAKILGVIELVPTYRDIFIKYDPNCITFYNLQNTIQKIFSQNVYEASYDEKVNIIEIPVVYGNDYGFDLSYIAETHNFSQEETIIEHSSQLYRVYMVGFSPGLAYLGGLSKNLHTDRRLTPKNIPAGSVAIGGQQTCVIPMNSPSGWWIIGWTPFEFYNLTKRDPCLLKAGDCLKFKPISSAEIPKYKEEGKKIWEARD